MWTAAGCCSKAGLRPWLMREITIRKLRLVMFAALFFVELGFLITFYIVPQFQSRNAPMGHWEKEIPFRDGPAAWVALVALITLLALGNIGLIVAMWRAYRGLKAGD